MLVASNATAQTCIPKPDCADMGYTKTSCSGAYLKCPFDTGKMACLADENAGRLCLVGMIYYSDGTCDSVVYSTKTPIGVVVKTNELVMSLDKTLISWGGSEQDINTLINFNSDTAKTDINGKANTLAIVSACTSDTVSNNAAKYCNSYSTAGTSAGDWYLPAAGEGQYVYDVYSTIKETYRLLNRGSLSSESNNMWTSSEYGYGPYADDGRFAWTISFSSGLMYSTYEYKLDSYTAFCFLEI